MSQEHRNTIFVEQARILSHDALDGDQQVLRIEAPKLAAKATPGCFAHIQCDPGLAMRRPMSVMRADAAAGWAEFLYKTVGKGTRLLAQKQVGDTISVLGPIGQGFTADPARPRALLIGGGVGLPPMVFLAERLRRIEAALPLVLMGSSGATLADHGAGHARWHDRLHATDGRLGDCESSGELARLCGLS